MRDRSLPRLAAVPVALCVAPPMLSQGAAARAPRWADKRRFSRIGEARTTYLPYPAQETVGNLNPSTTP